MNEPDLFEQHRPMRSDRRGLRVALVTTAAVAALALPAFLLANGAATNDAPTTVNVVAADDGASALATRPAPPATAPQPPAEKPKLAPPTEPAAPTKSVRCHGADSA